VHYFSKNSKNHCVKISVRTYKLGSDLISCLLQYSNPCAMFKKTKLLYSHKFRVPSKKNIPVGSLFFFLRKKSADVSYLFTKCQLLISPLSLPHYLLLQIKIVWNYIIFYQHTSTKFASKPNHTYWIFKWKKSWMIGASSLFFEILFVFLLLQNKNPKRIFM